MHAPLTFTVPSPGIIERPPRVVRCPNPDFPPVLKQTGPREFVVTRESTHSNSNESIEIQVDVRDPVLVKGRVDLEVNATITGLPTPVDVSPKTARATRRMLVSLVATFVTLFLLVVLYGLIPQHRGLTTIATQIVAYLGIFAMCRRALSDTYRDVRAAWMVSKEGEATPRCGKRSAGPSPTPQPWGPSAGWPGSSACTRPSSPVSRSFATPIFRHRVPEAHDQRLRRSADAHEPEMDGR